MKLLKYLLVFGAGVSAGFCATCLGLGMVAGDREDDSSYLFCEDDECKVVKLLGDETNSISLAAIIRKEGKES